MPVAAWRRLTSARDRLFAALMGATVMYLAFSSAVIAPAAQMTGVLSVVRADDFAADAEVDYGMSLVTPDGSAVNLSFTGKQPSQSLVGERVVASGHYTPSGFSVSSGGLHVARPDGAANTTTTAGSNTTAPTVYSSGNHRVAVIMINFQDDKTQPFTRATASGVAFTNSDSVAAYYKEVSWSQLTLSGAVYGWYTLPMTKGSSCSYTSWASAANTAAAADGFSINNYDNVVYAFPFASGCHWGGLAYKPGKQAWLNGQYSMSLHTMAHELGHNFGTDHAASISCTQNGNRVSLVSDISTCTYSEYGDPFSVMGVGIKQHTDVARASNYGWLPSSATVTATTTGDYRITPAEHQSGTPILQIQRSSSTLAHARVSTAVRLRQLRLSGGGGQRRDRACHGRHAGNSTGRLHARDRHLQ